MNGCSVVPGLPKVWRTPSATSCSTSARLPDRRGMARSSLRSAEYCGSLYRVWVVSRVRRRELAVANSLQRTHIERLQAEQAREVAAEDQLLLGIGQVRRAHHVEVDGVHVVAQALAEDAVLHRPVRPDHHPP